MAAMTTLTVTAQQKWTLRDCIDYAMQNNITLKQSQLNKQTTTETRKQSQAACFPRCQVRQTRALVISLG